MGTGKISVIMGVYNCADTLPAAIDSVIHQTYSNFEIIICDDGSTDCTLKVAQNYKNRYSQKIILISNGKNYGLNYTLNHCLKYATGNYIARMDGDDICREDRFEQELKVLDEEPNISIVSSDMECFDETGVWGVISHPTYPQKQDFIKENPFCHAPCLVKREAYDAVKGYTVKNSLLRVEDYHLWIKMYEKGYRGKNIHLPLYQVRDDHNAYSRRKFKYRINEVYVKVLAVKRLGLPVWGYVFAVRPIVVGLIPFQAYVLVRKKRLK